MRLTHSIKIGPCVPSAGKFSPRDAMQARPMPSCSVRLSVRPSVRPSRSWILSKRINISSKLFASGSHTILVFPYQPPRQYSDGDALTGALNARHKSWFWMNTWLSIDDCWTCERQVQYIPLQQSIASCCERRSLLMAGDDDKVYDKKPQRYSENNRAAFNCTQW